MLQEEFIFRIRKCNSGFWRTEKFSASTGDRAPVYRIPGERHNR